MPRYFILLFVIVNYSTFYGQTNLCQGSTGVPVFYEDFGQGLGVGDALGHGTISYTYNTGFPEPGEYSIFNNSFPGLTTLPNPGEYFLWHLRPNDWTYSLNNVPGKMLLINGNESSAVLYQKRIFDLCGNTTYEFSFWAAALYNISSQLCSNNNGLGAPVNFKIQIWNITQTQMLHEVASGDINNSASLNFQKYGALFTTQPGQTEVVLKIVNNNTKPGCGNDVAIDEIALKTCGDNAVISSPQYPGDEVTFCERELPADITLNLNYSGPSSHVRRWQSSPDGVNWQNITGETGTTLTVRGVSTTTYYRVKIASSIINVNNPTCSWVSNTFLLKAFIVSQPTSFGDRVACGDSPIPPLVVIPVVGVSIDWYDAPLGGNLVMSNSVSYTPPGPGTYYAQARATGSPCFQSVRTPVSLTWEAGVVLPPNPDPMMICGGASIVLDAGMADAVYQWSPNIGNTQTVSVTQPGTYYVTVSNDSDCIGSRTFVITGYLPPQIQSITDNGSSITVYMQTDDYFEYSIDNINWQTSNVFENLNAGIITVYVRDAIKCGYDSQQYLLLSPPNFITPNGDGYNDSFTIKGIEAFPVEILIFDRFGKLITVLNARNRFWDGTYNGLPLPSNDYWYKITMDNTTLKRGHFSIKR